MEGIPQYLISVTAAALFCGIINSFTMKKSTGSTIIKLLTGLLMVVTVLSPWPNIDLREFTDYTLDLSADAQEAMSVGEVYAKSQTQEIINQRTQAYILDKAALLGIEVNVAVTLDDGSPPKPRGVTISGEASPYAKNVLQQYIESNLAIPKENIIWK